MRKDIRKISIGSNYPDGSMHYQVGKIIRLKGIPYEIDSITINESLQNTPSFDIYIKNEEGTVHWKTITSMPTIIESNVDFE